MMVKFLVAPESLVAAAVQWVERIMTSTHRVTEYPT